MKKATVEPAGDRLLISLLVTAEEKKTFFGFGGDATVHVYGKPVLDQAQQVLRLTDIRLAVESEAAFGLLGAAAKAAMPYLQKSLADKAKVDLKPFAANARNKIAAAMKEFSKSEDGVTVSAAVTGLRSPTSPDAKTLRDREPMARSMSRTRCRRCSSHRISNDDSGFHALNACEKSVSGFPAHSQPLWPCS